MTMTLGEAQRSFTHNIGRLIVFAYDELGCQLTFGDAYRDPRVTYGHPNSVHRKRLAVDLNLFIKNADGMWVFQPTTEAHQPLGEWWEKQHSLARWGGRFKDGNHYSYEFEGVK